MAFEYNKQPWEEEIIGVDFSRRVPSGKTILPVASNVTEVSIEETVGLTGQSPDGLGSHLQLGTPALTGVTGKERILAVMVSAGVDQFKYRVSFKVTLSDGQKKEDDVWVIVKES
jgi:hypothetical protein